MTAKELLEALDGQEVISTYYERVVGVRGRDVIDGGEVIDILDTDAKVKRLFDELFENEFGGGAMASIEAEFGVD